MREKRTKTTDRTGDKQADFFSLPSLRLFARRKRANEHFRGDRGERGRERFEKWQFPLADHYDFLPLSNTKFVQPCESIKHPWVTNSYSTLVLSNIWNLVSLGLNFLAKKSRQLCLNVDKRCFLRFRNVRVVRTPCVHFGNMWVLPPNLKICRCKINMDMSIKTYEYISCT